MDLEVASELESLSQSYAEGDSSETELNEILELSWSLNAEEEDLSMAEDLISIRQTLVEIPTCSEEGELWKESLDLSIKAYLPEGLSEDDVQLLSSTAEECSTFKGPGVYLACRTLGIPSNDASACISKSEADYLRIEANEASTQVFPSPAKAGSILTTRTNITSSELVLTSISSAKSFAIIPSGDRSFKLPLGLISGSFVISYQSGEDVINAKIQVIE
jgi:hypothetical protein